jgi:hypothetical protein
MTPLSPARNPHRGLFLWAACFNWIAGLPLLVATDHPHEDIGSIVLKGARWAICLACAIITLRSDDPPNTAGRFSSNV